MTLKFLRKFLLPAELLDVLAAFTCAINREISIYVSRSGEVLDITIGGVSSVELKDMHLRRNTKRLSMVRCIHTHPGGNPQLSDVDISSLRAMRFDAMAAVGAKDGHATGIQAAFLGEYVGGMNRVHLTEVAPVYKLPQRAWMDAIERADSEVLIGAPNTTKEDRNARFWLVWTATSLCWSLQGWQKPQGHRLLEPCCNEKRAQIPQLISEAVKQTSFRWLVRREKRMLSSLMTN